MRLAAHSNIEYAEELKEKGAAVVQQTNELLNLWAQVRKQVDPEELGKQATRYFERMRGQQACEKALRTIKLHRPERAPFSTTMNNGDHTEPFTLEQHLKIKGDMAKISSFDAVLKRKYKLEVLRLAGSATAVADHDSLQNFKDIFSAVLAPCRVDKSTGCKVNCPMPVSHENHLSISTSRFSATRSLRSGRRPGWRGGPRRSSRRPSPPSPTTCGAS